MAIPGVIIRDKFGNITSGQPSVPKPRPTVMDRAQTQTVQRNNLNNTPSITVRDPKTAGYMQPIRQPAYETQLQTNLEAGHSQALEALRNRLSIDATKEKGKFSDEIFRGRWDLMNKMPALPGDNDGGNILANEQAARAAAFGRAKEQSGQTALAALQSIKNQFAGQGLSGSTMEGQATANVVRGAAGDVNDFTTDQMLADLSRSGQIADRNYAGNLTKRGQDLGYRQSLIGLLGQGLPTIY